MDRRVFRDLCILIAVIVIAAIGARILTKGETLEEYANKHPSITLAPDDSSVAVQGSPIQSEKNTEENH